VDAFYKTNGKHNVRRTDYSKAYHTFGLEWTDKYIFTYIDSRLLVSHAMQLTSPAHADMSVASFLPEIFFRLQ